MKVFRFELKKQIVNALIWTGVIVAVQWLMTDGFYPIFLDSRESMEQMIANFPAGFAQAFGFDLNDLFSFASFSNMVFLYQSIIGAIFAAGTTLTVFSREKRNKCNDFILTKPLSRRAVFSQKLLCCVVILAASNVFYIATYLLGALRFTSDGVTGKLVLSMLSLPLTELIFAAVGIFLAVYLRRIRTPAGLATGVAMLGFLLSAVSSLTEKKVFEYFSPLTYFHPSIVARTGGYEPAYATIGAVLIVGLTAAAYWKYSRADVAAQ